jgi:HD-like signal output (HDOD) protein
VNTATQKMLLRRVSEIGSLPAMPSILQSLGELLSANPSDAKVGRIVELISYDKSLAAQCLRVANSAMFRRRKDVETVKGAVVAMGIWKIRDIVYSCTIPIVLSSPKEGMAPVTFWRHALGTAMVTQHLAQKLGITNLDKFYLAGLLRDIGIVVNAILFKNEFQMVLSKAEKTETPLCEVEQQIIGFTHCDSGRVLADAWSLPEDVANTIEFHHAPVVEGEGMDLARIVHLADLLCRLRNLGYGYYEARVFDLASEPAWQSLAAKHPAAAELDLARFTFELDEHAVHVEAMVDAIFGGAKVHA